MGLLTSHRLKVLCAAMLAAMAALGEASRAQPVATELSIKTAFIFKFGEFITWPAQMMMGVDTFHICAIGNPAVGALLAEIAKTEGVAGRRVAVRQLATPADAEGCHILYTSGTAPIDGAAWQKVRSRPILVVADTERPESEPGVIRFVIQDDRVRFSIDDQQAADNQLTISSRLLAVALYVRRRDRD